MTVEVVSGTPELPATASCTGQHMDSGSPPQPQCRYQVTLTQAVERHLHYSSSLTLLRQHRHQLLTVDKQRCLKQLPVLPALPH